MQSFILFHKGPPEWTLFHLAALFLFTLTALLYRQTRRVRRARLQYKELVLLKNAQIEAQGKSDQPTDKDTLKLEIAPAIIGLLNNPLTMAPYTVALSGGWGSGKTSVMQQIEEAMRKNKQARIVRINAWYFQREKHLLTGFLNKVLAECNEWRVRGRQIMLKLLNLGFIRTWAWATWIYLALPIVLYLGISLLRGVKRQLAANGLLFMWLRNFCHAGSDFSHAFFHSSSASLLHCPFDLLRHLPQLILLCPSEKFGPISTIVTRDGWSEPTILLVITILFGLLIAALPRALGKLRLIWQLIPYKYELAQSKPGFRHRYQEDFKEIITGAASSDLFIFIDDIDRISGSRILELLEALNFIITCSQDQDDDDKSAKVRLFFILAMNVREVVRVVGDALDPLGRQPSEAARQQMAARYLSKLVDLTVNIPSLEEREINVLF